jgi:hypothetical protein
MTELQLPELPTLEGQKNCESGNGEEVEGSSYGLF